MSPSHLADHEGSLELVCYYSLNSEEGVRYSWRLFHQGPPTHDYWTSPQRRTISSVQAVDGAALCRNTEALADFPGLEPFITDALEPYAAGFRAIAARALLGPLGEDGAKSKLGGAALRLELFWQLDIDGPTKLSYQTLSYISRPYGLDPSSGQPRFHSGEVTWNLRDQAGRKGYGDQARGYNLAANDELLACADEGANLLGQVAAL